MRANVVLKRTRLYYNTNDQDYLDSLAGKTFSSSDVNFKRVSRGRIGWLLTINGDSDKYVFARHGIRIRFGSITIRKTKSNKYYCYIEDSFIPSRIDFTNNDASKELDPWSYISKENKYVYLKLKELGHLENRLKKEKRNLERKEKNSNNYLKQVKIIRKLKSQIKKDHDLVKEYLSEK